MRGDLVLVIQRESEKGKKKWLPSVSTEAAIELYAWSM
jgi:hypothetical protein